MRKSIFIFILCLSVFLPFFSFAVLKNVAQIEKTKGIAETTMYTMIYIRDINTALQQDCDVPSLDTGKAWFEKIKYILEKKYQGKSNAWILEHSWNLYTTLEKAHQEKVDMLPDDQYCAMKYILYHTEQYLREKHLDILKQTNIIKDFDGFDSTEIYGWATKHDLLDMKLKTLVPYIKELGTTLSFKEKNPEFKQGLTGAKKELFERSKGMMQLSLYKSLYQLKQAQIFTQEDINILKDKTVLEYVDNCQKVNGRYEIKETLKNNGEHIKYETEALDLKVNICGNFFILRDLDKTYEKIITHELGHHFYYYHDRLGHKNFENICWKDIDHQNGKCKSTDFVSDYAQTASVEDYAEHFMHWFLHLIPKESRILHEKSQHFEEA